MRFFSLIHFTRYNFTTRSKYEPEIIFPSPLPFEKFVHVM